MVVNKSSISSTVSCFACDHQEQQQVKTITKRNLDNRSTLNIKDIATATALLVMIIMKSFIPCLLDINCNRTIISAVVAALGHVLR